MKNRKKGTFLIVLALLALTFSTTGSILAQPEAESAPLAEITPENIQDLELLHWFGQGAFTGPIAQTGDGQTVAAVTTSGVALFDGKDGTQNGFIPIGLDPTALSVSADGSSLAVVVNMPSGEHDASGHPLYQQQIRVYDLPEGSLKMDPISDLGACSGSNIWDLALTPDGTQVVFEKKHGGDDERIFCRLSLDSGELVESLVVQSPIYSDSMAIAPNGATVAAMNESADMLTVYDSANFESLYEISFSTTDVYSPLLYAPSGRALGMRSRVETEDEADTYILKVWDLSNGELLYSDEPGLNPIPEYNDHDMVTSFEVSEDRRTLYLGTQYGMVVILDIASNEMVQEIGPFTWTSHWQTGNPEGAPESEMEATMGSVLLNPQGTRLIASEYLSSQGQSGSIHFLQLPSGEEIAAVEGAAIVGEQTGIAFSPDSGRLALAQSAAGAVTVFNPQTGQALLELPAQGAPVNRIDYAPNGEMLATASDDGSVYLWDANSGELLHTLTGHQNRVTQVAFAPDSSWLVTGGGDNTLRRWDSASGELLDTLELGDENWMVDFLDVLDDNTRVAYRIMKYPSPYIGYIQEQELWDTQSGQRTPIGGSSTFISNLYAGSPEWFSGYAYDSGWLVGELLADGSLSITATFRSPYGNGALVAPVLAPNHRLVMSGNGFGLHTWELGTNGLNFIGLIAGDELMPDYGNEYIFSPDGKYMAFTSGGVAYVLGVPAE